MVLLGEQVYDEGMPEEGKKGHWGRSYPQHLDHANTFLGLSRDDRQALAVLDNSTWSCRGSARQCGQLEIWGQSAYI